MTLDPETFLRNLNPQQREAVLCVEGPLLILAGAGSGKTRVITHRIAYLQSRGIPADQILAITFTNKAAGEMRERAERLSGVESQWVSTFHSFCARILRRHIYRLEPYDTSFTICDRDDCLSVVKTILKEEEIDPRIMTPQNVLSAISRIKNASEPGDDALMLNTRIQRDRVLLQVLRRYLRYMEERNLLDFDDLLLLLVRLFRKHEDVLEIYREQFRFVLIDEYQDTNAVQYQIGLQLAGGHRNICVTGDPDQSIYAWRGADIENILTFEDDFPELRTILLEQNYRSDRNILRVANALIAHNHRRKPKELRTDRPDGEPVCVYRFLDEEAEAREVADIVRRAIDAGTPAGDIAVFYRINALSRPIEQVFIYANIPYTIVGGLEFFLRREIKDVLAYLRVLVNPRDSASLKRILNVPPRGIGPGTLDKLEELARSHEKGVLEIILRPELREGIARRQTKSLDRFRDLYEEIHRASREAHGVESVMRAACDLSGYLDHLREEDLHQDSERLANVGELLGAAVEYDQAQPGGSVQGFLELTALLGDVDRWERRDDRVSLMTLHSAKGLEFPVVIIVGVEDGILPLLRASSEEPDIEEERRLLYVGLTRAEKRLYATHCAARKRFGRIQSAFPSRFLRELTPTGDSPLDAFESLDMDFDTEQSLHAPQRRTWGARDEFDQRPFGPDDESASQDTANEDDVPATEAIEAEDGGRGGSLDADFGLGEFGAADDSFPLGCRVLHDEYGEGSVTRLTGFGALRRVSVRFDDGSEMQFVVGYTPLRRL